MIFFFFFNDTATTEIYTLSLHDALPISFISTRRLGGHRRLRNLHGWANEKRIGMGSGCVDLDGCRMQDRKSTRLNSSHQIISYAVFCLKKKNYLQDSGGYNVPMHT